MTNLNYSAEEMYRGAKWDGGVSFDGDVLRSIPDSVVYRYPFGERTDSTLTESEQGADGTANGLSNVSGDWIDGFAESGDGTGDYGSLPIQSFGSTMDGEFYLTFTVESTDTGAGRLMGTFEGSSSMSLQIPQEGDFFTSSGEWGVGMQGDSDAFSQLLFPAQNDGSKHRIVLNLNNSDVSGWEVYVDSSTISTTVDQDNTPHPIVDFTQEFFTHCFNNQGSDSNHVTATIDEPMFGSGNLTSSEVQNDYDRQPWS